MSLVFGTVQYTIGNPLVTGCGVSWTAEEMEIPILLKYRKTYAWVLMSQIVHNSGLARESLYKALSPGSKPGFDTIIKVMNALGVHLKASTNTPFDQKKKALV